MNEGWKHLYGVIEASNGLNFGAIRVGDRDDKVYLVKDKGLSLVVSNTPFADYKTMPKALILKYLLDHQKVVERVMESYPILPFKFGSLAHTEKEAGEILFQGYNLFESLFPWVRERVEFELVVTWDREKIFNLLYEEEPEIRFLQEMIGKNKSNGDDLSAKIKLGKLVHECLQQRRLLFKGKILSGIEVCTESRCDHESMDDLMILNTALLLQKKKESELGSRVQELDDTFAGNLCFKLIGPLPPYSFLCFEIEWADAKEAREALTLLGLKTDASLDDLKNAYYQKAQASHPDKIRDSLDPPADFSKVTEAYKFLGRCYRLSGRLPIGERIPMIQVRTNGELRCPDEQNDTSFSNSGFIGQCPSRQ